MGNAYVDDSTKKKLKSKSDNTLYKIWKLKCKSLLLKRN